MHHIVQKKWLNNAFRRNMKAGAYRPTWEDYDMVTGGLARSNGCEMPRVTANKLMQKAENEEERLCAWDGLGQCCRDACYAGVGVATHGIRL